jgi:hypothetical protein
VEGVQYGGDSLSHVEPPRALVRVDELAESLLVLTGVELGLGVSVGLGLGLELGDVDVVDGIRDLLELETFRVCVAGSVFYLFAWGDARAHRHCGRRWKPRQERGRRRAL